MSKTKSSGHKGERLVRELTAEIKNLFRLQGREEPKKKDNTRRKQQAREKREAKKLEEMKERERQGNVTEKVAMAEKKEDKDKEM